jgi:NTP pyrophosphatase (non-canonical NTP hydrolase)
MASGGGTMSDLTNTICGVLLRQNGLGLTPMALAENIAKEVGHMLIRNEGQERQFQALRIANQKRDKLWDPRDKITPLFRAAEFAGEAGEICNVVKKLERQTMGLPGSRATLEQLAHELGDGVITLDLLAMEYDIDLWASTREKFAITSANGGFDVFL